MAVTIPCGTDKEHKLYSPVEASAILGCSVQTLNYWRLQGFFRSHKIGRGNYYTKDDLEEGQKLLQDRGALANKDEDRENIHVKYI